MNFKTKLQYNDVFFVVLIAITGLLLLGLAGCGGGGTTSSAAVDRSGTVGIQTTDNGGIIGGGSTNTLVLDPNQPATQPVAVAQPVYTPVPAQPPRQPACPLLNQQGEVICSCESLAAGNC